MVGRKIGLVYGLGILLLRRFMCGVFSVIFKVLIYSSEEK